MRQHNDLVIRILKDHGHFGYMIAGEPPSIDIDLGHHATRFESQAQEVTFIGSEAKVLLRRIDLGTNVSVGFKSPILRAHMGKLTLPIRWGDPLRHFMGVGKRRVAVLDQKAVQCVHGRISIG